MTRRRKRSRPLFATGFFKDVRIEIDRDVVIVVLEERPAIAQIDFVGLKEFDKDQLIKGLKEVGVAVSRTFRPRHARKGRTGVEASVSVARQVRSDDHDDDHAARS
jgi:outer membrane protein assembly factor BamA